jgi:uncharacterized membrane protein YczE
MFGLGIGLMLRADIGVDPWSTFHEGWAIHTGLSFGRITQVTGLVIIVISWLWLDERPGLGTLCNMLFVGPWVDLFRPHMALTPLLELGIAGAVAQFCLGLGICGLASGFYIAARLAAGPRDTFILGASQRFGLSVRATRMSLEAVVLGIGWVLGGPVGLGTLLFVLLMGPAMQAALKLFRYDHAEELAKELEAKSEAAP